MKMIALMIGAAALLGQGNALAGDEIDAKYQGEWLRAALKAGEENPVATGCLRTKLGSMVSDMTLTADGGVFGSINYVGDEACGGENFLSAKYQYNFESESRSATEQVVKVPAQYYEITVAGDLTVQKLNEAKVCGYSEWATETYASDASPLKDCTFGNMGMTIPPFISNEDLQNWRTKFAVQGTGVAVSSKHTPDGDYHHTTFYARKPAGQ